MKRLRQRRLKAGQKVTLSELARFLGGLGGKARAKALTPERRREIAKKAIAIRWAKAKKAR
jgi:hypothetical protein